MAYVIGSEICAKKFEKPRFTHKRGKLFTPHTAILTSVSTAKIFYTFRFSPFWRYKINSLTPLTKDVEPEPKFPTPDQHLKALCSGSNRPKLLGLRHSPAFMRFQIVSLVSQNSSRVTHQ